ncbi:MAG: hypothetical protein ACJ8AW_52130 [Rhodopila sp.]
MSGIRPAAAATDGVKPKEGLFIQVAEEAAFRDGMLTLDGVGRFTTYFADRPARSAGKVPHERFLQAWSQGANSFASDPPNAGLTYVQNGEAGSAVVELSKPSFADGKVAYSIKVLDGSVPANMKQVSLFIDAGGLMQCVAYGPC